MQKKYLSKKHLLHLIVVVALIGISGIFAIEKNYENGIFHEKSGLNLFYYTMIWGNSLLNVLFPILPSLLIEDRACAGVNSLKNAVLAALELSGIMILFLLLSLCGKSAMIEFCSDSIYSSIFGSGFAGTIAAFLLNLFFLGFAYGFLGSVVYRKRGYGHFLVPLVLYNINIFNPFTYFASWLPMYCYDVVSIKKPLLNHFVSIFLIILLAAVIHFLERRKRTLESV